MNQLRNHAVTFAMLCAACGVPGPGSAQAGEAADVSMELLSDDYPYLAVDQALPDALRELGHNLDVTIDVSSQIKGRLRHYEHRGSAGAFLNDLADEHRLDWVFHNGRLFVSSADEQIVRAWQGGSGALDSAKTALASAGIADARYPLGFDAARGKVSLTAPPPYMELAAPVIDQALAPKATHTVNVIHGRARDGGS